MDIQEILKQEKVNIIDVRESYEYNVGHVEGAVNMPLSQFQNFVDVIKKMEGKKVFYCRSGNRSGQAVAFLKTLGVKEVYNGGSLSLMNSFLVA
jgi:rhodanese-related sulfurtransferase